MRTSRYASLATGFIPTRIARSGEFVDPRCQNRNCVERRGSLIRRYGVCAGQWSATDTTRPHIGSAAWVRNFGRTRSFRKPTRSEVARSSRNEVRRAAHLTAQRCPVMAASIDSGAHSASLRQGRVPCRYTGSAPVVSTTSPLANAVQRELQAHRAPSAATSHPPTPCFSERVGIVRHAVTDHPDTMHRHRAAMTARMQWQSVLRREAPRAHRRARTSRSRSRRGATGSSRARAAHRRRAVSAVCANAAKDETGTTGIRNSEADALRDARGDPHTCERTGTAAERYRIERSLFDIVQSQQRIDHRQHQPVVLTRHDSVVFIRLTANRQRDGTRNRRRLDRQQRRRLRGSAGFATMMRFVIHMRNSKLNTRQFLGLDEALTLLRSIVAPIDGPAEIVALADAAGRVVAETIIAPMDVPPFFASAMDGYAICGDDPIFSTRAAVSPARCRVRVAQERRLPTRRE